MPKIHPLAVVDPSAVLADGVEIGPFCVVEDHVTLGEGTVLRESVIIRRHTTMGKGNIVDPYTVLGGEPQDLKFSPSTVSFLRIGDDNVFREGVTISRATTPGGTTSVGNKTYWMAGSHAGHDSTVEDHVILVNGSAIAGHTTIHRSTILSGNVLVHQFTWVGEMVMTQGHAATSQHVPPFCLIANVNRMFGLNMVGLRRSPNITDEDRRQLKEAFTITYRARLPMTKALAEMDKCADWKEPACKFRDFVRKVLVARKPYNRGLIGFKAGDPVEKAT